MFKKILLGLCCLSLATLACSVGFTPPPQGAIFTDAPSSSIVNVPSVPAGDQAVVTNVIDGDTIDVQIQGIEYRVRYLGVNTPERDETCYQLATDTNRALVAGRTVTLVRDRENTDRFGRLLRYIYVGNVFVNAALIEQGVAEVVQYPPNVAFASPFIQLEQAASAAQRGCHPTGIFNDGNYER